MTNGNFNDKGTLATALVLATNTIALGAGDALNWRELLSVKAMTSYVAHNQNVPETQVKDFVAAAFAVTDIAGLRRDQFDRVIAFLVDLNSEMLTN